MMPCKPVAALAFAVLLLVQAFAARAAESEADDTAQTVGMNEAGTHLIIDSGHTARVYWVN